jgi:hypothetical protein
VKRSRDRLDRRLGVSGSPAENISALPGTELQLHDRSAGSLVIIQAALSTSAGSLVTIQAALSTSRPSVTLRLKPVSKGFMYTDVR